jgi:glycosyltransferase involved in cell wall biosynthesis
MDGRMLVDAQTGVATYARSLRQAIATISNRSGLLVDRENLTSPPPEPFGKAGRVGRAFWPLARIARRDRDESSESRYRITDAFRLAQVFLDLHGKTLPIRIPGGAGIAHWSYPLPLHIVGWTNIYTIHDLIPLTHIGMSPIAPARHRRLLRAIAAVADGVVTVSESALHDVATEFGPSSLPMINCGQPVDVGGPIGVLPADLRSRGYLLVLGSVEVRKNIPAIVAAHRASGVAIPLVISGPDGWGASIISEVIGSRNVKRLPYLPSDAIRTLLSEARALVMASLAEGFGLPVAEAMALGTPVITSDRGALAETAGGAALLVDPADEASIAGAMRRVATDDVLWHNLSEIGKIRADAFTPSRFATRLGDFYGRLREKGS